MPCCFDTPVAGQNVEFGVDQDRVRETELLDAVRDLPHLLARMGSSVALPRAKPIELNMFEATHWVLFLHPGSWMDDSELRVSGL